MTVNGRDVRRSTRGPGGALGGGLVAPLFAALLAAACSTPPKDFDGEALLKFSNVKEGDSIKVNVKDKNGDAVGMKEVPDGAAGVRLRFKGMKGELNVYVMVHYAQGGECTFHLMVKADGYFEVTLDLTGVCPMPLPPPDAGAPPLADAGPPPSPDAQPDLRPDLQPDTTPDLAPSPECQQYCTVMHDKCPSVYLSESECHTTCRAFGWVPGERQNAQNTLNCRIGLAARVPQRDDPEFCRYAGPSGGNACGLICRNLCDATARICPGSLPGGTEEACNAAGCDPSKIGPIRAESGDTIDCRFHWLTVAASDAGQSCARLKPESPDWPCR